MYRNIHYNIQKGYMKLFTWNDAGERVVADVPFNPYVYVENESNADAVSIFNTNLAKKSFKNSWDRNKYLKNSGLKRIFYNIPAEQQFLIDLFGSKNNDPDFSQDPLKIYYLDIETYSPGEFPDPKIAPDKINVITIYDSLEKKFHTWGTGGSFYPPENGTYYPCTSESDMLQQFLRFWRKDFPDIITGWNSEGFDVPYIINRINNILGEGKAEKLSPVGKLYCKENVKTKFGQFQDHWYIKGISHLDYMNVYKTFTREKRERYSLDFIGETELDEHKKFVPASDLPSFADNDWQGFCEYNVQDVNLIVRLEEQLHYLKIVRKLAYIGYTTFEQALGTITMVTGAVALKAIEKGKIIPTFQTKDVDNYEGGFVREPQRGLKGSVVSFDANSLYPNTIISTNISPETKVGKILEKTDTHVEVKLTNDKIYQMPHDKFYEFVQQEELAITSAKVLYSQKTKGFCPEILDDIYSERVVIQEGIREHKKAQETCDKKSREYDEHAKAIIELDVMQYTLKTLMNRLYGAFGNTWSPFYDIDAAASVTLTGQACIKEAAKITDDFMSKNYGVEDDCTIYGDTDSVYITIEKALESINGNLLNSKGEISKETYEIAEKLEEELNSKITDWSVRKCNVKDPRFKFKRETICNSGLFLEKKRYILHVLDDGGFKPSEEKEIKYTGVEVVSIKIPKKVKPLIKNISKVMLKTRDQDKTYQAYKDAYQEYLKLDVEDIATPIGINNYEKYEEKANGFQVASRTPGHVKAAIMYNRLLERLGLTNKYEKIVSGDDIKTFYAKKNGFAIRGMAFKDVYPREFDVHVDKLFMFNKNVTPAVERLYDSVGWKFRNPTKESECDLLELFKSLS